MNRLWVVLVIAAGLGALGLGCETRGGGAPESGEGFSPEYSCGWRAQITCDGVWVREEFRCHEGPCTITDRSAIPDGDCVVSPTRVTEMLASCEEIAHALENDGATTDGGL